MTGERLASLFEKYLAEGWGYVLGANGELYTQELAEKWASTRSRPASYYLKDCARWFGRNAADCSGGIVAAMRSEGDFSDRTANTFKSQFVRSGDIDTIPELRGLAVWKDGHIGIYAGNRNVIEFRGTRYGCVMTNIDSDKRGWKMWGELPDVDYAASVYPCSLTVTTKGGTLNLRKGGRASEIIATMPNGAPFAAYEAKDGWVYGAYLENGRYLWGYASKNYLA